MPISDFHERVLAYAQILYERALARLEKEELRKAQFAVTAAMSAATFVSGDDDTPNQLRGNASNLKEACETLLSEIWASESEGYGRRFMSGTKTKEQKEAAECRADLESAMRKVNRLH